MRPLEMREADARAAETTEDRLDRLWAAQRRARYLCRQFRLGHAPAIASKQRVHDWAMAVVSARRHLRPGELTPDILAQWAAAERRHKEWTEAV